MLCVMIIIIIIVLMMKVEVNESREKSPTSRSLMQELDIALITALQAPALENVRTRTYEAAGGRDGPSAL